MAKIVRHRTATERTVTVKVGEVFPMRGTGNWEIIPEHVTMIFAKADEYPEKLWEVSVRGERVEPDPGYKGHGNRVWREPDINAADFPGWLRELVLVFTVHTDLSDQLRNLTRSAAWIKGEIDSSCP